MADRHVRFALGDEDHAPYAIQLRITPEMLAAIRSSSAAGSGAGTSHQQQHSIQLDPASNKAVRRTIYLSSSWINGKMVAQFIYFYIFLQVVSVGGEDFHFKTLPDQDCSVLKSDAEQEIATVQGSIAQKLQPVRTVAGTAASLAATAAAAAKKEKAEKACAPLPTAAAPAPVPIISPLDSQKRGLPLSSSLPDPATLNLLRNSLVEAAAQRGSTRLVLISLLARRPSGLRTLKTYLDDLQHRITNFNYPQGKGELEHAIKKVAAYKAPGSYVLFPELESEIVPLVEEAQKIEAAWKEKAEADRVKAMKKKRKRLLAPASVPLRTPTPTLLTGKEEGLELHSEPPLSPAARRKVTPSLPSSSPTLNEDEDGGTTATGTATAASRPLSSSSRGSGGADESWVLEHAQRLPEPAPLITTATDYHTANAEFHRRYLIYFKLHQLLSANRRDFEALQASVDDAPSIQEKEKIEAEVERLWARRARRSRRWEAAFQVLHEELAEWKDALSKYASSNDGNNRINNAGGGGSVDSFDEEI
jgi:hypothetical protein